jgi:hypothetical protein
MLLIDADEMLAQLEDAAYAANDQVNYEAARVAQAGLPPLPGGVRLITWTTRTRLMGWTHSRGLSDWSRGPYWLSSEPCLRSSVGVFDHAPYWGCHSRVSDW